MSQIITVGVLPNASVAKSYILQIAKDQNLRDALKGAGYRNIVISEDNLEALKQSGNITVYMELFRKIYLGR